MEVWEIKVVLKESFDVFNKEADEILKVMSSYKYKLGKGLGH
jgi:hypothetical protein